MSVTTVRAKPRPVTVDDFEDLPNSISSFRDFWSNPVAKVLLVTASTNLGSTLGAIVAGAWIAARTVRG